MQNRKFRFGPVALTTTLTTNILNPTITSVAGPVGFTMNQPYLLIYSMRISNKTASPATFSLWLGATGANTAGTELGGTGVTIGGNAYLDISFPSGLRMDAADFLVGGSNTATALTISGSGEIGVSG